MAVTSPNNFDNRLEARAELSVSAAVDQRFSARAFLETPVDPALLREILQQAGRAPSGGNVQPWNVIAVAGAPLADLKTRMAARVLKPDPQDLPGYAIYPPHLWEPHRSARFEIGEQLYGALGIARDNKPGRMQQFARNFAAFGAPLLLFVYIDKRMGPPQWSDVGMWLQTLMLLLKARGLDSCAQEAWSLFPHSVAQTTQPDDDWLLFCGVSIGYADPRAPENQFRSARLPLAQWARFVGC
ncbi:nitroreductase [Sinimarinibacterium sp. NLF-5-8]|uniref:nitroreductase n=1 Tax=Sinimarinibacterium sp. NLF-5-8 TaxID=2698684 RepID=UPI001EE4DD3A|nr:nitroreductase [Sinimarinibacterium sp. NLF-5-8]